MAESKNLSTLCVHSGELNDAHGSPHTPLYNTTTFVFEKTSDIVDVIEGRRQGSLYTRYGWNPSIVSVEAKLAAIEQGESALLFSSGMAAISAVALAHGRSGIVCFGELYGGTQELFEKTLPQLGIKPTFLLKSESSRLEEELKNGSRLVYFESPSNPTLDLIDIQKISELAHKYSAIAVIDNTFATPVNQQPLTLGVDLVLHSATKYLGGHSDITAGVIMGAKTVVDPVWSWRKNLGQTPSAETASLLARSLRTLVVRVERQNQTAAAVAKAFVGHPKVQRVLYPGLETSENYALAKKQMKGFGGMLSLELKATLEETSRFVDRLKLFRLAPSLGGPESLVNQSVLLTHHALGKEEQKRRGISDSLVRFSVGLEDADDLIADLEQALKA